MFCSSQFIKSLCNNHRKITRLEALVISSNKTGKEREKERKSHNGNSNARHRNQSHF